MLLAVACGAVSLPKDALKAREAFEVGLQVVTKENEKQIAQLGDEYLQQLRKIESDMQVNGQLRGLVVVHDELARFATARAFAGAPVNEPVELRDVQARVQIRILQVQYSNEFELVKLGERYVQELGLAREAEGKQGATAMVKTLDEERDRVLALPALRRALESTKIRPPTTMAALTNMLNVSGTESRRQLDIFRASSEPLQAAIGYKLKISIFEDMAQLRPRKADGAGSKMRAVDGVIGYIPRFVLSCQHSEIPSGSRLVVEYYSRSLADRARRRELVENIVLPRLERGESYTVDGKGVQLQRSEQTTSIPYSGVSRYIPGSEFYGLIIHVVDPARRVLMQRFLPQSLERDVAAIPPEK